MYIQYVHILGSQLKYVSDAIHHGDESKWFNNSIMVTNSRTGGGGRGQEQLGTAAVLLKDEQRKLNLQPVLCLMKLNLKLDNSSIWHCNKLVITKRR
jgi:hypothetical protein